MTNFWLIVLLLPAIGFAWRGTALLLMSRAKPSRIISASGVVAATSMLMFAIVSPIVISEFEKIFTEFDVDLPALTSSTLSFTHWYIHLGLVMRCFFGLGLSLCVLMVPEILFYRAKRGHAA